MASYNTARHFNIDHLVGAIAPGRFADVVAQDARRRMTGLRKRSARSSCENGNFSYVLPIPQIDYPEWARNTMNGEAITAEDFLIAAPKDATTVTAALMSPFSSLTAFHGRCRSSMVLFGSLSGRKEVAVVDRYAGTGQVSKMF